MSGLVQILESEADNLWDSGEPEENWLHLFIKATSAMLEVYSSSIYLLLFPSNHIYRFFQGSK